MPRYYYHFRIGVEYGGTSTELQCVQPMNMHNIIHKSTLKLMPPY